MNKELNIVYCLNVSFGGILCYFSNVKSIYKTSTNFKRYMSTHFFLMFVVLGLGTLKSLEIMQFTFQI